MSRISQGYKFKSSVGQLNVGLVVHWKDVSSVAPKFGMFMTIKSPAYAILVTTTRNPTITINNRALFISQ